MVKETREHAIEKLYWTLPEVAEMLGISVPTIRFYDVTFNLNMHRNQRSRRRLTHKDIDTLRTIIELRKTHHIEGIKIELKRKHINQ